MKNILTWLGVFLLVPGCKKQEHANGLPKQEDWVVTTAAGNGNGGFADGPSLSSSFHAPLDIAAGNNGILFVADALNHRIRKIVNGWVTTLAGYGQQDTSSGTGTAAGFAHPSHVARDDLGNIYTLDIHDYRIRKIDPNAAVTVVAGSGIRGFQNGSIDIAQFGECSGIAVDAQGTIYVTDYDGKRIRKINNGVVSTVAGNGIQGFVDGKADAAEFFSPTGLAADRDGNLFVADFNRIRKITPAGMVSTFVGQDSCAYKDGSAATALFQLISDIAFDKQGNLYATDEDRIRKINVLGDVSTVAGSIPGYTDGSGGNARFNNPVGLDIDSNGNIYVADDHNNRIRKISLK